VLLVFLAFGYLTLQRIQEKKRIQNIWWNQRKSSFALLIPISLSLGSIGNVPFAIQSDGKNGKEN
jgi:hypothetical protein